MADSGASQYTFHLEATKTPEECIRKIKESGMNVGLAIKPNTPVEDLLPFINDIDMALVMIVEPGKGGQPFNAEMLKKVRFLRDRYPLLNIEIDGGVSLSNVQQCACQGANMIVSGTGIINSPNRKETIDLMRSHVVKELEQFQIKS